MVHFMLCMFYQNKNLEKKKKPFYRDILDVTLDTTNRTQLKDSSAYVVVEELR